MDMYRLFIAMPLPQPVKAALVQVQARLRRSGAPVKWVAPELMHLTLHFLGATEPERVPQIVAALRQCCASCDAIRLRLTISGAFPNLRKPMVVWAGIGGDLPALGQLVAQLRQALTLLGLPLEERQFRPHLTLGRTRRDASPAALEQLGDVMRALPQLPPVEWVSNQVVLFRSELLSAGPVYTRIADCQL